MSENEKQANKFLKSTGVRFEAKFLAFGKHFDDDKEDRDIYECKLINAYGREYVFKFGQSIANSGKTPTPYNVLACLTKNNPGDFENFCGEFGYESDSRKAFKVYKGVKREWKNIERLFSDKEIERLQEIYT